MDNDAGKDLGKGLVKLVPRIAKKGTCLHWLLGQAEHALNVRNG
jgi:hypothetical protein